MDICVLGVDQVGLTNYSDIICTKTLVSVFTSMRNAMGLSVFAPGLCAIEYMCINSG